MRREGASSDPVAAAGPAIERLAAIMARLRDPETGCAWDVTQTFATIAPYTIEEAYEVADAIERGAMADLAGELGDLQLQVVFHARMAEEAGDFTLTDVIAGIADKMERRHPHVFARAVTSADAPDAPDWEAIKSAERAERNEGGALAGVALGLPALLRAEKLQRRAARTGFDWPDAAGPRAKVIEEISEVDAAPSKDARMDEIGDLLFAAVNWARHLGIDAEAALRAANAKFERRFAAMETMDAGFAALPLPEKERLWGRVKAAEQSADTLGPAPDVPPRGT